jgi:flagellar biosynthesis protein FlhF
MKRYVATDMRTALRQIRLEQGPEAVILGTRQVPEGVEVCAAVDDALAQEGVSALLRRGPARAVVPEEIHIEAMEAAAEEFPEPIAAEVHALPVVPVETSVHEELRGLRRLLEQQFAALAWNDFTRCEPFKAQAFIELAELGIGRDLTREIVAEMPTTAGSESMQRLHLALLARRLRCVASPVAEGGRVALVGPSGAGKTTTLAKLAARWVLEHEADSLVLMSVDDERIGGGEQLRVLGRLLGVPVEIVADADVLAQRLAVHAAARLVLIDTPGLAARGEDASGALNALRAVLPDLDFVAVLPASAQAAVLEECVQRLHALRCVAAILTRVDEAASLGGVLSALLRAELPAALIADGPRIPEDLRPARAHQLIARAVELARESGARADEDLLATRFGGSRHVAA